MLGKGLDLDQVEGILRKNERPECRKERKTVPGAQYAKCVGVAKTKYKNEQPMRRDR